MYAIKIEAACESSSIFKFFFRSRAVHSVVSCESIDGNVHFGMCAYFHFCRMRKMRCIKSGGNFGKFYLHWVYSRLLTYVLAL